VPRYFFHLYNDEIARDDEGIELPNDAAALQRGEMEARNMAAESVRKGHLILDHRIVVCAEDGNQVGVIHFRDVVAVQG
jgi:hypothetical protein